MPPAAISRSSTYFPKICGNIAAHYPSAFLAASLTLACGEQEVAVHPVSVVAHELSGCPAPRGGVTLKLTPLGAFRPGKSDIVSVPLRGSGQTLAFSPETQRIEAVTEGATPAYLGYSAERQADTIDVLLWPQQTSCVVHAAEGAGYPGAGGGQALGFSPLSRTLLLAGEDAPDGRSQSALELRVDTGLVTLQPAEQPVPTPTAYATLTAFGAGFLLAGGENPLLDPEAAPEDRVRSNVAYVFDPVTGDFQTDDPIPLDWDRSRHAALALENGATLLIGGRATGGLVKQLQAVFPESRRASTVGLAELDVGRLEPRVVALDDGRIVVGGGRFENGDPVGEVEWLSADGSQALAQVSLPARQNRAFFGLPGGGVLSVAGCDGDADCAVGEASWITPDYDVADVVLEATARCPFPARPLLVPGLDGTPLLVSAAPGRSACAFHFNPWPGDFSDPNEPDARPRFLVDDLDVDPPPDPRVTPLALGASAFAWVAGTTPGALAGMWLDSRGALSREDFPLVTQTRESFRPLHLVPDRPLEPPRTFDGSLKLLAANQSVTYWVTDTRYEDVTVSIDLNVTPEGDDPRRAPPALRFGRGVLGTGACAWPALPGDAGSSGDGGASGAGENGGAPDNGGAVSGATVTAVRRGVRVTLTNGGHTTTCEVDPGALALGIARGAASADVRAIRVERD